MKNSPRIEKVLPFVLAILLPGLNFLNNSSQYKQFDIFIYMPTWIMISLFLVVLWYLNDWLNHKIHIGFYLKTGFINIFFILLFISLLLIILPNDFEPTVAFYRSTVLKFLFTAAIFITIQQSLKSTKRVEQLKSENLSLKTEKYKTELEQLRKQVNPHFLFNSLSVLRTMVRGSNPNSEKFVLNLSSLYRQILQTREQDYVTLEEEIKFLNAYIYLLKVRHEDSLDIKVEIIPKSHQYSIPIFSLQLLVENCVKHNILSVTQPLNIHIFQKEETTVTVSNNYQPRQQSLNSNGVGLNNLLNRYKLLGIEQGLDMDITNGHFSVTIKLF